MRKLLSVLFSMLLLISLVSYSACSSDDESTELCSNTCVTSFDQECDDGGPGSLFSICSLGTDCADCGTR